MENVQVSVSEAIALINQSLEYAFPVIAVEGEVSGFKVNQNKYVFFDIKDEAATLGCFMMVFALKVPLEDGMRVRVVAKPTLTKWGKFSLTVQAVVPTGEGSIKRAFELLKASLEKEGLFSPERKRLLPLIPERIGIISSTQAAGYSDFMKIVRDRWPAVELVVAPATVQGMTAPESIMGALRRLNELSEAPDVIAIVRGGGSADDLAAFNDEALVRAVAASRIPVITGVGHETDVTLIDYAADVRAATPSNVAERIVPDRHAVLQRIDERLSEVKRRVDTNISELSSRVDDDISIMLHMLKDAHTTYSQEVIQHMKLLEEYNPRQVLRRGYALLKDAKGKAIQTASVGDTIKVETKKAKLTAEVTHVE